MREGIGDQRVDQGDARALVARRQVFGLHEKFGERGMSLVGSWSGPTELYWPSVELVRHRGEIRKWESFVQANQAAPGLVSRSR